MTEAPPRPGFRKQGMRKLIVEAPNFVAWVEDVGLTRALTEMQDLLRHFDEPAAGVRTVTVWATSKRRPVGIEVTRYALDEAGAYVMHYYDEDDVEQDFPEGAVRTAVEMESKEYPWIDSVQLPSWWDTVSTYTRSEVAADDE